MTIAIRCKIISIIMNEYFSLSSLISEEIHTVSSLNAEIKALVESGFGGDYVWVAGEISNFKGNYSSGHWYFSLKDEASQISAVCFKWLNQYVKFKPENGMEVLCCAEVSVYEKNGSYQLAVRHIEPKGVGAQALALRQLKEKLLAEGLFDPSRKRPLPFLPRRVGIVTSPSGAALRDILKVLERRFANLEVIISPTRVQGAQAPADIVKALGRIYRAEGIDLIILARGGGSGEDLWAFNDESVAREIARSPVPLISAVGHEIDTTVADLVADVRASTPSVAAEIAVREKSELEGELLALRDRMGTALRNRAESCAREIERMEADAKRAITQKLGAFGMDIQAASGKLDALSPLKILERGYAAVYKLPDATVVKEARQLRRGDEILIKFHLGAARCSVEEVQD
ncbi:MAG: exodeoxyribonuclease VII large subunit [Deltaproteobacteria bacterium]